MQQVNAREGSGTQDFHSQAVTGETEHLLVHKLYLQFNT